MPTEKNEILVQFSCDCLDLNLDFDRLEKLIEQICKRFDTEQATISVAIINDEKIKKVNKKFLNTADTTDVISFDLSDEKQNEKSYELVINAEQAMRQAKKLNLSIEAELALYITHGMLHNLGFNDTDAGQSKKMHDMENQILQQAGFGIIW